MQVIDLELEGLKLIVPTIFSDERGFFLETYNAARYAEAGIVDTFVQDNHSWSVKGTLRGLHYQSQPGQGKLVWGILPQPPIIFHRRWPELAPASSWRAPGRTLRPV